VRPGFTSKIIWLIPEKIAKSSVPDYSDLILWKAEGINSIVNLLEDGYHEIVQDEKEVGFNVLHSPISDFDAPTLDQLIEIVRWIDCEIDNSNTVLVHCYAGIGRTGTVLIAYLIHKGQEMKSAAEEVLKANAAPQSLAQKKVIEEYYQHIKGLRIAD
jgi:protein-tyrosine phosphatase